MHILLLVIGNFKRRQLPTGDLSKFIRVLGAGLAGPRVMGAATGSKGEEEREGVITIFDFGVCVFSLVGKYFVQLWELSKH